MDPSAPLRQRRESESEGEMRIKVYFRWAAFGLDLAYFLTRSLTGKSICNSHELFYDEFGCDNRGLLLCLMATLYNENMLNDRYDTKSANESIIFGLLNIASHDVWRGSVRGRPRKHTDNRCRVKHGVCGESSEWL